MRPGYRQTEVGVIPEEWEVVSIGDLASFSSGTGIKVSSLCGESADTPIPVYGGNGISGYTHNALVNGATVVVGRVGQKCGEVYVTPGPAWITDNALYPWSLHREFDVRFLGLALAGAGLNDRKNRNDLPLITQGILHSALIAWPPREEQRAIAVALRDMDALLVGLDRLITKKRDLKQAAMQQLLTGRMRLPGFSGAWEVRRLGDLGSTYGGLTGKTKEDFGVGEAQYIPFINVVTNVVIDSERLDHVRVAQNETQNRVMRGDLLFNGSSETPEEVGMCSFLAQDVANLFLNSFCFGFRLRSGSPADGLFLAYYVRGREGREIMKSLAQGSTRYNLSKGALLDTAVRLPPVAEQAAIAAVLSDMDAELAACQARRDKTRVLKEAMMQELLTGRTRLV